jgi:selenocysteine-specific elongation factor
VAFFSSKKIAPGERAIAQLRFETPAFVFAGDRFVVRDWAGQNTLAGGRVLDAEHNHAPFRSAARLRFLRQRAESPEDVRSYILSQLARDGAARMPQLLLKSRFSEAEIGAAISTLAADSRLTVIGPFAADTAIWSGLRTRAMNEIDSWHREQPARAGMLLSELRARIRPGLPLDDLFDELIRELCASEFVQARAAIRRASHRPALPSHLQDVGAKLRAALARKPFDPPSRKELSPDANSQQALLFLVETGEAVEINAEVVMAPESEKRATELICRHLREHGPATVSDLRQLIGSSRRVIIPFLERLDRAGVTERVDDRRMLRQKR